MKIKNSIAENVLNEIQIAQVMLDDSYTLREDFIAKEKAIEDIYKQIKKRKNNLIKTISCSLKTL